MEETVLYVILGLSIFGNILLWIFITNLLNQIDEFEKVVEKALNRNDKLNEDILKYHQVLQGLFTRAYSDILKVDKNGSFSSDDEVGWSFTLIKETIRDIQDRLENLKRKDGEEE